MPMPAIALQEELIRSMSVERKLEVSQALREAAWELKAAWIRSMHPELPEPGVQEEVRRLFRNAGA